MYVYLLLPWTEEEILELKRWIQMLRSCSMPLETCSHPLGLTAMRKKEKRYYCNAKIRSSLHMY